MLEKGKIRDIYALGAAVGVVRGGDSDELHALVYEAAGKEHVSELTEAEYKKVRGRLLDLMRLTNHDKPLKDTKKKEKQAAPGMMTKSQIGLAWRQIYRLIELGGGGDAGARMRGAIHTVLGLDVDMRAPFRWISQTDGRKLIEALKGYVKSAERQVMRDGAAGAADTR
jgi:hypothetical protein